MARERIVVGATGDGETARHAARRLRDSGHEVVFVGGAQSTEQLARTAVAEDATRIVVDAGADDIAVLRDLVSGLGAADIDVAPAGA